VEQTVACDACRFACAWRVVNVWGGREREGCEHEYEYEYEYVSRWLACDGFVREKIRRPLNPDSDQTSSRTTSLIEKQGSTKVSTQKSSEPVDLVPAERSPGQGRSWECLHSPSRRLLDHGERACEKLKRALTLALISSSPFHRLSLARQSTPSHSLFLTRSLLSRLVACAFRSSKHPIHSLTH
jgi:hypothetical protein